MSKTAVSELNARMSIDTSSLERDVPRATAFLKRLSLAQAEAFAAQSGGPDIQAMTERFRAISKSPGVIGAESGETIQFASREKELKYVEEISDANDESLRRRAAREAAVRAQQKNAVDANLAEIKLVDDAMAATAQRQAARVKEQMEYEQMLADRRAASAKAQIEFADAQRDIVSKNARESAAAIDAEMSRREAAARSQIEFADAQRDIVSKNARESAAVFDAAIEAQDQADAQFTSSYINRSAQRRASINEEAQTMVTNAANLRRMGNTAGDSQKGFARFGLAMQQTGYQVQDFAVQVTSGTNALVAFSQQSSQLLGFFGGWQGAVAGAVISAGILAYRLYETGSAAKAAIPDIKKLSEAVKSVQGIERGITFESSDADTQVKMIREDMGALKEESVKLQISSGYAKSSEELTANLNRQEEIRGKLIELADKERNIIKEKAKTEREAAIDAQKAFNERVNAQIQASLAEGRARMQVVGTELQKLQMDMSEATDLVNSKDPNKRAQGWQMVASIKAQADAYKDSLDPLRAQKREIEKILAFKEQGLLNDRESNLLQLRIADERARQLKLPDMFKAETGASFAGLRNTDGTASQIVATQQQMLAELRKLVWQGSN